MIHLRPANADDQPRIRKLIYDARLDPSYLHWQNFVVAQNEQHEIVGVAQIKPYADCKEFGSFAVQPAWRNRGVGRQIIENVLAQQTGVVHLMCNQPMQPYYAKYGFVPIGFWAAPRTLKLKLLFAKFFRIFGIRIVCMKKD